MKYIYLILLAVLATGFYACSDFLEAEPMTSKTTENYFSSVDEFEDALIGCYDGLQLAYNGATDNSFVSWVIASNMMGDLCYGGTGVGDDRNYEMVDAFDLSICPSATNMYLGNWESYYRAIYRCNILLNKLNENAIDWSGNEDTKAYIEGESRFLRALYYFDMVRLWGSVPLLTEPSTDIVPQADIDDIYTVITQDLLFAIDNCRSDTYTALVSTDNYGHATRWAAESLLARVFLFYTGYNGEDDLVGLVTKEDALNYLEDVISKSQHDLIDNYYDLWPAAAQYQSVKNGGSINSTTYAGESNKEVVFAVKSTKLSDYNGNTDGTHWQIMIGIRWQGVGEYGYGFGYGGCTVTKEFYDSFDANDDRRDASIIGIDEEDITFKTSNYEDQYEYTGYYIKKYVPLADSTGTSITTAEKLSGSDNLGNDQDYIIIRYADVLLMAAELGSTNALTYVNKVRNRAGLEDLASVDKDAIYEERKKELAFEGIRYWDLLRYESTLQYAADAINVVDQVENGGTQATKTIDGNKLIECKGLSEIPATQISLSNGQLLQNAGWE